MKAMDVYMNENIFREYDIRGIVQTDFSKDLVVSLGKAFGTILVENNFNLMSISGDVRHTTQELKDNFIKGVLEVGVNVYDMGVLPTPTNYFSLFNTDVVNSVQITGSHNPSEYNGFKISFNKKPFYGESIQKLKKIILTNAYHNSNSKGMLSKCEILDSYISFMKSNIKIKRRLNVAMDCGNAVACVVAPTLFKDMKVHLNELYCNVDPNFPNHHPDPTVDDNLLDLIKIVINKKCDFGVAYDGDADRIVAIDEKGSIIRSDILIALFLEDILQKNDPVIYDVKCSNALKETILKFHGKPLMWKTGHSHIKNKMIETKAKIGGEMSGHIFFSDKYFGYDDGIYVSLRLAELISNKNEKLSTLVSRIPKYVSTPEIRVDCQSDEEKREIVKNAINYFKNKYICDLTDGVRIEFDDGWGLIRQSNTQPVIVFRFEASTLSNLKKNQSTIFNKLKEFGNINVSF